MPFMKLFKPANPNFSFLVERICLNNTYGYSSGEGRINASRAAFNLVKGKGTANRDVCQLFPFLTRENNTGDALSEIVSEFKGAVSYLTRYHDCVLPLSGDLIHV